MKSALNKLGIVVLFFVLCAPPLSAQFQDMVRRVPDQPNTLILFNVEGIHRTPLAIKENWRESHEKTFEAGLSILPPDATKFLMTSQMDFDFMQPVWESALYELRYDPSMPKVAAATNGQIDEIHGLNAVLLPTDTYVVRFGPNKLGAMSPGNRQNVNNWVGRIHNNSKRKPLTPYLTEAVGFAEEVGTPIIMAMDFTGVPSASKIRSRLSEFETLKNRQDDYDKITQALVGIRGVTLGITIQDKVFGKIKVDFEGDVSFMKDYAKDLLLEVLAKNGAMIDEFQGWTATVSGNQVSIGGNLYTSGIRRLMSVLDTPPELHREVRKSGAADPQQNDEKLKAAATQQYWKSMNAMLGDLQSRRKSDQNVTWGQVGLWFERYARKIDQLPILNVDDDLVEFGAYVATQLRGAESAMKGIGVNKRQRETELPNYYNVNTYGTTIGVNRWGRYGAYGYTATPDLARRGQERSRIRTQESIRGNASANLTMQGLQQATADMRRYLTKKYNVEF